MYTCRTSKRCVHTYTVQPNDATYKIYQNEEVGVDVAPIHSLLR